MPAQTTLYRGQTTRFAARPQRKSNRPVREDRRKGHRHVSRRRRPSRAFCRPGSRPGPRSRREKFQEVASNLKGAVDNSIKEQPMATLAMVAVLGFVLGAIWKS